MRQVTERDFRQPEFADAKVEDYEFRSDGKLVRKDRWEQGLRNVVSALGMSRSDFEIPVVKSLVGDLYHTMEILYERLSIEMPKLDGMQEDSTNPFNDIIVALDAQVPARDTPNCVTEPEPVEVEAAEPYDKGYLKEAKLRRPK